MGVREVVVPAFLELETALAGQVMESSAAGPNARVRPATRHSADATIAITAENRVRRAFYLSGRLGLGDCRIGQRVTDGKSADRVENWSLAVFRASSTCCLDWISLRAAIRAVHNAFPLANPIAASSASTAPDSVRLGWLTGGASRAKIT